MDEIEKEARKALRCLFIAVPSEVAADVRQKVLAWVDKERAERGVTDQPQRRRRGRAMSENLKDAFSYHQPGKRSDNTAVDPGLAQRVGILHDLVRRECHNLAAFFESELPDTPATFEAIKKVREAMFWGNASIACNQHDDRFQIRMATSEMIDHEVHVLEHERILAELRYTPESPPQE